jgi:hypothetical protein
MLPLTENISYCTDTSSTTAMLLTVLNAINAKLLFLPTVPKTKFLRSTVV